MSTEVKLNVSQSRGYENASLELVKIKTNEQGQKLVSGRELHEVLEIGVHFSTWMKRMCEYGFQENIDFSILKSGNPNGGIAKVDDYAITLEMAKHIAMVQRTEIGMKVRNYFIECEKKAENQVKLPSSPMEVMELMFTALKDTNKDVAEVKADLKDHKENSPLYNIECDELQKAVKKKAVHLLGGRDSKAYKDKSLRQQVFGDLQNQIKREFGVSSYKAIKRSQLEVAKEIVGGYKLPHVLEQEVYWTNNQMSLM